MESQWKEGNKANNGDSGVVVAIADADAKDAFGERDALTELVAGFDETTTKIPTYPASARLGLRRLCAAIAMLLLSPTIVGPGRC